MKPKTLKEQGLCSPKCPLICTAQCSAICGVPIDDIWALKKAWDKIKGEK